MNQPTKHHFVPAFYLSKWAVGEPKCELVQWSKPYKAIVPKRRHPNATGFQPGLYSFESSDPNLKQWFESVFLRDVDTAASLLIDRIIGGQAHALDAQEKSHWARFLMTLHFRHPDVVEELRADNLTLWKHHELFTRESYALARRSTDPDNFDEFLALAGPDALAMVQIDLLTAAMDNPEIGRRIVGMAWDIIDTSQASSSLLTSDWPIDLGMGDDPPIVALPLGPNCIFVASDDPAYLVALREGDLDALVLAMNTHVVGRAQRYVFSSDESQEAFIKAQMSTQQVQPPYFPSIKAQLARWG